MPLTKRFLNDTTRHEPRSITPEPNTIYLMARNAGLGVDHLYYLYTNNKGEQFSLSGFPRNARSQTPSATFDNFINGGGGWGSIIRKAGSFSPGTPDYFDSTKIAVYRSPTNNPNEVARDWQLLIREYDKIVGAAIPYRLNGYNSNSAAATAERNWGNSIEIIAINQQFNRTDVNAPGYQYDQIIEWYPNTQKSDTKDFQKIESYLNQSSDTQMSNVQRNIAAFSSLSGVRNSLAAGATAKQSSTGNADLDKALAILDEMKQEHAKSAEKQKATPEPVAVRSRKDREIGG